MISLARRFLALPVFVVSALVFALAPALVARMQDGADKTVFVSVVDTATGKPVTDLKTEHFVVAEDNVERKVKSAKLSTQPVFIELLADTSASTGTNGIPAAGQPTMGTRSADSVNITQDLRKALAAFVNDVTTANPASQVALMEFGQASITMVKFTSKVADLEKGINKLFPIPQAQSVLSEAILQASGDLQKVAGQRRVIMIFNVEPGSEASQQPQPQKLNDSLKKSQASLWAVSLQQGQMRNPAHDVVLNALANSTGGRREVIVGQSAIVDMLKQFWTALNAQYEVTYTRPSATPTAVQVRMGIRADGVKVYCSYYAPQ
jgi:VWFA-related protein